MDVFATVASGIFFDNATPAVRNLGTPSEPWDNIYVTTIIPAPSVSGVTSIAGLQNVVLVSGLGNTTITTAGQVILVSGTDTGEVNTASNVGTGYGWFKQKTASDLEFKTVTSGNNIVVASNTNDLQVGVSLTPIFTSVFANLVSGTTFSGNTLSLAGNITFQTSGTSLIGTASSPINVLFANEISGVNARGYVFAYDTTTQSTAVANTFQDITFDNSPTKDGWSHTPGTATFTCNLSGVYQLNYTATMNRSLAPNTTPEIIITKNGTEIAGSQISITVSNTNIPVEVSNSIVLSLISGDLIKVRLTSSSTSGQITAAGSNATTRPSIRLSIIKV